MRHSQVSPASPVYLSSSPLAVTDEFLATEVVPLASDTLLTIALSYQNFGGYGSWKGLASLIPELYLNVLWVVRLLLAYRVDDLWAAQVQRHSAALYVVRFSCAIVAASYSAYVQPTRQVVGLGLARVALLGTMVLSMYIH